jgi:inhibitor of KinA
MESPSGWQIIGRTPLKLFDPNQNPPTLLKAGDYLTFINISLDEFNMIKDQVGKGMYQVRKF